MAEKSSWGQANLWQKLGLVCRNRKKTSQIIKDYFPFFLLIILCPKPIISTWGEFGKTGIAKEGSSGSIFCAVFVIL
jgi:hypothetical protein